MDLQDPLLPDEGTDGDSNTSREQVSVTFEDENDGEDPTSNNNTLVDEPDSFFKQVFLKTSGPPQITLLMLFVALGLGCTVGVVPTVMTDRFARLDHAYDGESDCSSFSVDEKPEACSLGSSDAQTAASTSNLISNVLTFLTSSLIGSLSDEYGRRGVLISGLFLSSLPPLILFMLQLIPSMSPWWYYGMNASTGLVNWTAVALSAFADVLPRRFRAPGIGLLLAGFMLGFSLAPILALILSEFKLSLISFVVVFIGFFGTILFMPETLQPRAADEARRRREREENAQSEASLSSRLLRFFLRPFQEMSILNRNTFFRLVSLLAFFSGMVSWGDQVLLSYYLEDRLGFTTQDISNVLLVSGTTGLAVQAILLKPLNDCVGEKILIIICFSASAINNFMIGLATNKRTVFAAVAVSALSSMAFPTISAIKSNNVAEFEQGRIQGALYSLQALAGGLGPVLLRYVNSKAKDSVFGAGSMFIFAGVIYLFVVGIACALPKDKVDTRRRTEEDESGEFVPFNNVDESGIGVEGSILL